MAGARPETRQLLAASARVEQARAALTDELERLPPWGTHALWAALRATHAEHAEQAVSPEALVHFLRHARRLGDTRASRELFVLLLARTERLNHQWAARTVARTPALAGPMGTLVREDLRQEFTLHLWEQLAIGDNGKWELFFGRALDYAQRHTARAYMQQRGYWAPPGVQAPARGRPQLMVSLSRALAADGQPLEDTLPATAEAFDAAELADLGELVARLPSPERMAVVMRFWQDAGEAEMAGALGVTTRTVRNYLRRAYERLRAWYAGTEDTA